MQEVEKSLKEQINALYKSTGINAKFSMQYALKDKPSAEKQDLHRASVAHILIVIRIYKYRTQALSNGVSRRSSSSTAMESDLTHHRDSH